MKAGRQQADRSEARTRKVALRCFAYLLEASGIIDRTLDALRVPVAAAATQASALVRLRLGIITWATDAGGMTKGGHGKTGHSKLEQ